jgi:tryptophanase
LPAYQSVSRLIDTVTNAWDDDAIREFNAAASICRIGVKGVDTLDLDVDQQQLDLLADSGRQAMTQYLKAFRA